MNWEEYEDVTKYIYETLGRKSGVKIAGHGRTCRVVGKSGISHQIDVLTVHTDGIHQYKTAIECKYWDKKVNKDVIMKIANIVDDSDISKGVVVSRIGFTKDSALYAKHKNIGLIELREFDDFECDRPTNPTFMIGYVTVNSIIEHRRPVVSEITIDSTFTLTEPAYYKLQDQNGDIISLNNYIDEFKKELHNCETTNQTTKYYHFKGTSLIDQRMGTTTSINELRVKGNLLVNNFNQTREFELEDKVWMTMKSIFEGRSYSISQSGIIKENNDCNRK